MALAAAMIAGLGIGVSVPIIEVEIGACLLLLAGALWRCRLLA